MTTGVTYKALSDNIPNQPFTFEASAQKGYKLNGITASRNGITRSLSGNGTYTVGSDVTGTGLTITFDTAPVKGNLTVSATGTTAPAISTSQGAVTVSQSRTFNNTSYATAIIITVNGSINNINLAANGCDVATSEGNGQTTLQVNVWDENATLVISHKP